MNYSRSKPRFVAIDILNEILGNKKSFHELRALGVLKNLKPNEKAFVQRLVMDTLRNLDRCDRLLEKYWKAGGVKLSEAPQDWGIDENFLDAILDDFWSKIYNPNSKPEHHFFELFYTFFWASLQGLIFD